MAIKEVTIKVPQKRYKFFNDLMNELGFAKKETIVKEKPLTPWQKKTLKGIERGLKEMQLVNEGKMKTKPLKQLLDELQN